MKKYRQNDKISKVEEDSPPFMKTFSSQQEAELYNLTQNINKSDMEKFKMFCRMMRIGKMLSSAKIAE
jgi:hypothetical protein